MRELQSRNKITFRFYNLPNLRPMKSTITSFLAFMISITSFSQTIEPENSSGSVIYYNKSLGISAEHEFEMRQEIKTYDSGDTVLTTIYCVLDGGRLVFEFGAFRHLKDNMTDVYYAQGGGERKSMCGDNYKITLKSNDWPSGVVADYGANRIVSGSSEIEVTLGGNQFVTIYKYVTQGGTVFEFF